MLVRVFLPVGKKEEGLFALEDTTLFALVQNGSSSSMHIAMRTISLSGHQLSRLEVANILSHTDLMEKFNAYGISIFTPLGIRTK